MSFASGLKSTLSVVGTVAGAAITRSALQAALLEHPEVVANASMLLRDSSITDEYRNGVLAMTTLDLGLPLSYIAVVAEYLNVR